MAHRYKAILFDLGNVWVNFDHRIAVNKIVPFSSLTAEEIFNIFFDSRYTQEFEEGRVGPREFFNALRERLKLSLGFEEFLPIWNDIFFLSPDNLKVHSLARLLKKDFAIFLISNINILHFEFLKKQFDVFGIFDGLILSYEVGARKPDFKIYDNALRLSNAASDEVIYIDDRLDLITEARNMGISGIHFKCTSVLKEELHRLGITDYE